MPEETHQGLVNRILQIPMEEFVRLMASNEPCRAVVHHLYGADSASSITDFGEDRWDAVWSAALEVQAIHSGIV